MNLKWNFRSFFLFSFTNLKRNWQEFGTVWHLQPVMRRTLRSVVATVIVNLAVNSCVVRGKGWSFHVDTSCFANLECDVFQIWRWALRIWIMSPENGTQAATLAQRMGPRFAYHAAAIKHDAKTERRWTTQGILQLQLPIRFLLYKNLLLFIIHTLLNVWIASEHFTVNRECTRNSPADAIQRTWPQPIFFFYLIG